MEVVGKGAVLVSLPVWKRDVCIGQGCEMEGKDEGLEWVWVGKVGYRWIVGREG